MYAAHYIIEFHTRFCSIKHVILQVKAEELTLGDIVEIKFGDRYVPHLL